MMMKSSIDAVIVLFILQLFSQLQTKNLEFEHFVYTLETLEKKMKTVNHLTNTNGMAAIQNLSQDLPHFRLHSLNSVFDKSKGKKVSIEAIIMRLQL